MLTSVPITIGTCSRMAARRPYRLAVSRNVCTMAGLVSRRYRLIDAADDRLEARRQVPDQVEHHLFGAADGERVRHVTHPDTWLEARGSWLGVRGSGLGVRGAHCV